MEKGSACLYDTHTQAAGGIAERHLAAMRRRLLEAALSPVAVAPITVDSVSPSRWFTGPPTRLGSTVLLSYDRKRRGQIYNVTASRPGKRGGNVAITVAVPAEHEL